MSVKTLCRICGSNGPHSHVIAKEMMFGTREEFQYFQCAACECLQILEPPEDLSRYYPPNYYSYRKRGMGRSHTRFYSWLQKQRCRTALFGSYIKLNRILAPFISLPHSWYKVGPLLKYAQLDSFENRFLDVGCGEHSLWLEQAKIFGFRNLLGVDPFINKDKTDNGIKYLRSQITDIAGEFKYITFHHSLEHIFDQHSQLQAASRLLAPGGVCFVRIPIVSSYLWESYGVCWVDLDAPRHFYLHSVKSIVFAAERAGLRLIKTVYDSTEFDFAGSEQYKADIPLHHPRSYLVNSDLSIFSKAQMDKFRREAERVNRNGVAGRAGFLFCSRS